MMSGNKNKGFNPKRKKTEKSNMTIEPENLSPTVLLFKSYQIELDTKYDKYERLIKKSRDLTIESKRIIFLLHRVNRSGQNEEILNEAKTRLSALLLTIINEIGTELCKQEVYQYIRAFTGGLQEFVEALSFYHYIKNGNVMCLEEIYNPAFFEQPEASGDMMKKSELPLATFLTPLEYALGIADLTGELMRKCINSVCTGDIEEPFKLSILLQNVYQAFLVCRNHSRDFKRKMITLKCSVQKVENACYAIKLRGTEMPSHMLADFFSTEDEFKDSDVCDI